MKQRKEAVPEKPAAPARVHSASKRSHDKPTRRDCSLRYGPCGQTAGGAVPQKSQKNSTAFGHLSPRTPTPPMPDDVWLGGQAERQFPDKMPSPSVWYSSGRSYDNRSGCRRNRRHQTGVWMAEIQAYLSFVLLGREIASQHLLRYNKDNQYQRLIQEKKHPQRRQPLHSVVNIFALFAAVRAG